MISRNKRFMAGLASLAAMGIALAGCGSSGDSTAGEDKGKSDGPVTITYLHRLPDSDGMTKVDDIVAR